MQEQELQQELQQPQQEVKNKAQYILKHDRSNCIGCAACAAVAPDFWEMNDDGKSDIINCRNSEGGWQELDLQEKDFELNKDAAETCPVNVIHIIKKDTGEKII